MKKPIFLVAALFMTATALTGCNSQGGNQYSMEHSMRSSMEVFKEYSMNVSKTGMASISGETILVWASGDILELSVISELPEISGNYNARACMV